MMTSATYAKNTQIVSSCKCSLTKFDVYSFFMFKKKIHRSGRRVIVVINEHKKTHSNFLREWLNTSESKYKRSISRVNKLSNIRYVKNDKEMYNLIKNTKGAIGYLNSNVVFNINDNIYKVNVR